MSSEPKVLLARGADDPAGWAWIAAIFALYLLIGYGLEYRSKKRRGVARPARAAAEGLWSEREGIDPVRRFAGRMVMLCGALVTGLAGFLTRNAHTAVQFPVVGAVALLGIFAWAYFDHRTEPRGETGP
ncbi:MULTISPECIES: hypothetical protein [unclassified Streptomyces]|uniref:hypothetical protein n=1 Tax=unclassified Streptomyces TaxID=2593676 RepID=UPI0006AFB10D|nr:MULTISPECIES: hypothetical protein [unclassified Streptomyces]KOX20668.1 hypothetical protein ADL06_27060 [Streptomyces sp. NRRL F-6491]KOX45474.1 hypothetical protein ADL08_13835 [Streptomyces sp. NRRL F-6492]